MARTSRRNKQNQPDVIPVIPNKVEKAPAAAYVRLSVEETEGDTIDTQLEILNGMKIEVEAHAIQAAGFADADAAWTAFDGQHSNS